MGVFLRFVIFKKEMSKKNCPRYFQIRKYAFRKIFEKGMSKKLYQVFSDW